MVLDGGDGNVQAFGNDDIRQAVDHYLQHRLLTVCKERRAKRELKISSWPEASHHLVRHPTLLYTLLKQ